MTSAMLTRSHPCNQRVVVPHAEEREEVALERTPQQPIHFVEGEHESAILAGQDLPLDVSREVALPSGRGGRRIGAEGLREVVRQRAEEPRIVGQLSESENSAKIEEADLASPLARLGDVADEQGALAHLPRCLDHQRGGHFGLGRADHRFVGGPLDVERVAVADAPAGRGDVRGSTRGCGRRVSSGTGGMAGSASDGCTMAPAWPALWTMASSTATESVSLPQKRYWIRPR